jgi:hypothetical protein
MRKRKLSDDGLNLFNIAINKYPEKYCIEHSIKCYGRLKEILYNLWTTEYDIELDMTKKAMRNSSKTLYSFLKHDGDIIPYLVNNAVINIIMLILTKDKKLCNYHEIKMNYGFYCNLAMKAKQERDHQTALLILCALEHHCFNTLKIKKKYTKQLTELQKEYGSALTCYSKHMNNFLNVDDYEYLPSVMIMQMQMKKTHEQEKGLKFIKTKSQRLITLKKSLQEKIDDYYNYYKDSNEIIDIYKLNPLQQFDLLLSSKGEKITNKLFDLIGRIKVYTKKSLKN